MITIRFLGGAKKTFDTEKIIIDKKFLTLENLIHQLKEILSQNSRELDFANVLIAINGIDSSVLHGKNTTIKSGDVVSIIPVIHGGSPPRFQFKIHNYDIEIMEISKKEFSEDFLDIFRKKFPKLKIQGISSTSILSPNHVKKILMISIESQKNRNLLSNKLETDLIMRFAGTNQISQAINRVGLNPENNLILIAMGDKISQDKLFSEIKPKLIDDPFSKNNSNFLKKRFMISNNQIKTITSKTPLEDLLAERAAILVG